MVNISKQAFSEVYDVINHMEESLYNKIPKKFIELIEQNRDLGYTVNINYSISINQQSLLKETRLILSLIYRDYLCDKEERENLIKQEKEELVRIENELREKYNPDNLFKNRSEGTQINKQKTKESSMIEYKKEGLLRKLLNKIFEFFKR